MTMVEHSLTLPWRRPVDSKVAKLFFDLTFGTCIVGSCRLDRATLETTALGDGNWKVKVGRMVGVGENSGYD